MQPEATKVCCVACTGVSSGLEIGNSTAFRACKGSIFVRGSHQCKRKTLLLQASHHCPDVESVVIRGSSHEPCRLDSMLLVNTPPASCISGLLERHQAS